MKTEVQTFCTEFSDELEPFSKALDRSLADLSAKEGSASFKKTSLSLQEVQHRLSALQEKMDGQQAFLLIFGPLKSGKSTLMNAISGTYVSEVSSLPAYPALVYVKNGERNRFQATTYSGDKQNFKNNAKMAEAVEEGHKELAKRILEVEKAGESFDPKEHYPEAIRRMDVEVQAESLAESGSVLVDTPGLYSRMRFGYDLMTRDFRDTAACAIFVVKTDNLFFEKVFEEFNQLLGCFSRIFLVANIDSAKQDLNPDGTLRPSLESSDPTRLIQAFENLSMSAPLKEAYTEGRLRVYPIDLLKAACKRLSTQSSSGGDEAKEISDDVEAEKDGFDLFLGDLTEYLNSSDYLHDFMFDSLRFANDLREEAAKVVDHESAEGLRHDALRMEEDLGRVRSKIQSIDGLGEIDWDDSFGSIRSERDQLVDGASEKYSGKLGGSLESAVDLWMNSDSSLAVLRGTLKDKVEYESREDSSRILGRLKERIGQNGGGARFSGNQMQAFSQADLNLSRISSESLDSAEKQFKPDFRKISIDPENIPVRRRLADYMMFRSSKKVRTQFFGHDGGQPLEASAKQSRLDGAGVDALKQRVNEFAGKELAGLQRGYVNEFVDRYVSEFSNKLKAELAKLRAMLDRKATDLEKTLEANREAQKIFDELYAATENFEGGIAKMKERYKIEASFGGESADLPDGEPSYAAIEESSDGSDSTNGQEA